MRFNELIAGVRGDIAIKVFGDDSSRCCGRPTRSPQSCASVEGAADVKVEQATGLPFLEIKVDKTEIARRGLSLVGVQDVIGAAVGGREAGVVFEGDRRFDIVVRLPDCCATNLDALRTCRSRCRHSGGARESPATIPLKESRVHPRRRAEPDQPRERQAARRRHRQCPRPRHRFVGCGSAGEDRRAGPAPGRILDHLGRPVREPDRGAPAAAVGGAGLLLPDLPAALYARSARRATRCSCSARCRSH